MSKPKFKGIVRTARLFVKKHSPEIMTGIGIAGMLTTTVLAVKATPKALMLIEDAEHEKEGELTPIETVKVCWKCYVPAAVTAVGSAACLIGASSVNLKRNAALATAYKISETALTEYKEKVIETIGEKKEKAIQEKVDQHQLEKNPVSTSQVYITNTGDVLCYEFHNGRYFRSDMNTLQKAVNEVNRLMLRDGYASLNDFYDIVGLDHTDRGACMGWKLTGENLELEYRYQPADTGEPCLGIKYSMNPDYGFDSYY